MNKFELIYNKIIKESNLINQISSKTDYTPDQLVEKIFDDIKAQGFDKSFALEYTLSDFKKYVTQKNYDFYSFFIEKFKGTDNNFAILILCWDPFDQEKLNKYFNENYKPYLLKQKELINKKDKFSQQELKEITSTLKSKFAEFYKESKNEQEIQALKSTLKSPLSQKLLEQTANSFYKCEDFKSESNEDINSKDLFKQIVNTYIKSIKSGVTDRELTNGYCLSLHGSENEGFVFFINKHLINKTKNKLKKVYKLINHEIDHYFELLLNSQMEDNNQEDQKTIDSKQLKLVKDKQWIKYLFSRTEFNSRSTDLCNTLLNDICPISKENSLKELIEALNLLSEKQDWTTLSKFKWFDQQDNDITDTLIFGALTLKLFPEEKWPTLKERLQGDFELYTTLPKQKLEKYKEELEQKFSNTPNKLIQALAANPKKLETAKKIMNA